MQREQMFVKPAPGRVVRDPSTGLPLPEGGAGWWRRRSSGCGGSGTATWRKSMRKGRRRNNGHIVQ